MVEDLDEVTIRIARVDDAPAIARVHVRSWQEAYESIVPAAHLAALDPLTRAEEWTQHLASGPHDHVRTWLAESDGAVLGFATVGPCRDEDARRGDLEIYSMYLDPGMWGRGVARPLVRTIVQESAAHTLSLWVLAENDRARHFFRRNGFQPDGTERYDDVGGAELLEVRYRRG
ncbi:GNAT family N-acetyltransferase [Cellulomonas sp. P22]|uniref:GNAT family N-acetyltransferase n=1 Tax=Cellulomonas sp. P22 TaxID=3373189 RepID=UPI00378A0EB7